MIYIESIRAYHLCVILCFYTSFTYGQVFDVIHPDLKNMTIQNIPKVPNPTEIFWITDEQKNIQNQNQQIIRESELQIKQEQEVLKQLYADQKSEQINIFLPGYGHIPSSKYYREAYSNLLQMNPDDFSIKKATFIIENAFYEEQKDYEEFNQIVNETGNFLRKKMNKLGYNPNSNLAKNLMIFKFFSDTLEIKSIKQKHLPLKYDFDDYMGNKDWSNMFVQKLLKTGKGQCNSLPRLYLILAEEIGAEAFLALAPNHSYIKFRDEDDNWYNVELTNGMFTTDSFILQSGFIKSEALQNDIYMQTLTNRQLMAQILADFASGYVHKLGYDYFVKQVADKAIELYPNLISAQMLKANFLINQFEYATYKAGINPRNHEDLQNIRYYPPILKMLREVNIQYKKIDELGYEFMSADAYERWLELMKEARQKQDNESIKRQFNIKVNQTLKN